VCVVLQLHHNLRYLARGSGKSLARMFQGLLRGSALELANIIVRKEHARIDSQLLN
jgi:hypothetical protein